MSGFLFNLGLVGLVLLCLLCPCFRAPAIEDDVREAAVVCATDAGFGPEQVAVSGRDVTLGAEVRWDELDELQLTLIAGRDS